MPGGAFPSIFVYARAMQLDRDGAQLFGAAFSPARIGARSVYELISREGARIRREERVGASLIG